MLMDMRDLVSHHAPRFAAVALSLMMLPLLSVQSPAHAVSRDVSLNSVTWDTAKSQWKVNVTANYVSSVWANTYKNGDFSPYHQYRGTEKNPEENAIGASSHAANLLPDNAPKTAIKATGYDTNNASSKTVTLYVNPYPGAGPGTGNATYLRVYGWSDDKPVSSVLYAKPLHAPQSKTAAGNAYTLKVASFNVHCHPDCRHTTKAGLQVEQLKWAARRLAVRDAILKNPIYLNKATGAQDMPDVVGFQELAPRTTDGYTPIVAQDADLLSLLSGSYGKSTVNDVARALAGKVCDVNAINSLKPTIPSQERIFYRKAWYTPVTMAGVEQSGSVSLGCTARIKARTLQYVADKAAKKPVLNSDTSQWRSASYSLLQRVGSPGAGQKFWVISAHPTSNYKAPTQAEVDAINVWATANKKTKTTLDAVTKEHNTRRAEARAQAATELKALSDSLTARVNVPVILIADANSETSDSRNGNFGSVQSNLVTTGGFKDSASYGSTAGLNWASFNNFSTTLAPAKNGDGGRIDYIMFKGARGADNFRNHLLGYSVSGSVATAKSVFRDPSRDTKFDLASSPPSDHNLQTVELKMPY